MNAINKVGAVVLLFCTGLVGCAPNSIKEEPPAELTSFKPELELRELWSRDVGSLVGKYDSRLTPALDGGVLYVANAKGDVSALATESGDVRWEKDLDVDITGATGVGDGIVAVGTRKGEVIALDATSGAIKWTAKVSSEVQAPPVLAHGMVVVQTVDGRVAGLDIADGKQRWVFDRIEPALSLHGTSTPVIIGEYVLAGFANGKIYAVSLKDGKQLWERTIAEPRGRNEVERLVDIDAHPLLWGEHLFAVAYQGKVVGIDMRTGRELWSRDVSSYVGMDADREVLFVADDNGEVVAFDREAGASRWRQDKLRGRVLGPLVLHGSALVVGDYEGYLHWLARDDGRFLARYRLNGSAVRVRGIVDGNTLYVAAADGELAALQLVSPE